MNIIIEEIVSEFPVIITEEVFQISISDATSYFELIEVQDKNFTGKDGYVPEVDEALGKLILKPKSSQDIPTKTSDLTNDGEDGVNPFITAQDVPSYHPIVSGRFIHEINKLVLTNSIDEDIIIDDQIVVISITLENARYLRDTNGFIPGVTYLIQNADEQLYKQGGTPVYLLALENNKLDTDGIGIFWNPKYNKSIAGFGIFNPDLTYSENSVVFWGGYAWRRRPNGVTGISINQYELNNLYWGKIGYSDYDYDTYYNKVYDKVKYSLDDDKIYYRNEKNLNEVSFSIEELPIIRQKIAGTQNTTDCPIKAFQWGNGVIFTDNSDEKSAKGIGAQYIIDSYNQNINFRGRCQYKFSLRNGSYMYNNDYLFDEIITDKIKLLNIELDNSIIRDNAFNNDIGFYNIKLQNSSNINNSNFTNCSLSNYFLNNNSSIFNCTVAYVENKNMFYDNNAVQMDTDNYDGVSYFIQQDSTLKNITLNNIVNDQIGRFFIGPLRNSTSVNLIGRDGDEIVDLEKTLPINTSDLTNDGSNGVNPYITALDIPTFASADKMVTIGRNSTGATLRKGTIVYISGSTGNRPNFVKAQANSEATSAGTFGVVLADILNNTDGNVVTIGAIDNLDTRSTASFPFTNDILADGDTIYLSPTTAGFVTNIKPSAPNHLVYIGKVTRISPTQGTIVYRIQNGYELEELHNVAISSVANEDFLQYEASTSLWKNIQLTASWLRSKLGITTLSGSNTGDQDLSGLALKSMSAYSLRVNNTNAAANAIETNYRSQGLQTLTGISWTGTTAPTGGTQQYQWQQEGNKVTAIFTGNYATAGTLLTQVNIALPSDMPTPIRPAGITATANYLCYVGTGRLYTSLTFTGAFTTTAGIVVNSTDTSKFDVVAFGSSLGVRFFWIQVTYFIA